MSGSQTSRSLMARARLALVVLAVFALTAGFLHGVLPPHPRWIQPVDEKDNPVAFSPDGRVLALTPSGRLLDLATGHDAPGLTGLAGNAKLNHALFTAEGVAFCQRHRGPQLLGQTELVRVDPRTGLERTLRHWPGHWPANMALSPDGRAVAACAQAEDGCPVALYAASGETRWEVPMKQQSRLTGFSPDGTSLVVVTNGEVGFWGVQPPSTITLLDTTTGATRHTIPSRVSVWRGEMAVSVSFTPDGHTLVVVDPGDRVELAPEVRLFDAASGASRGTLPNPATKEVKAELELSADRRVLLAHHLGGGKAQVYDLASRQLLLDTPSLTDIPPCLSPDGRLLAVAEPATGLRSARLAVYATDDGRLVSALRSPEHMGRDSLRFLPGPQLLVGYTIVPTASPFSQLWDAAASWLGFPRPGGYRETEELIVADVQTGAERARIPLGPYGANRAHIRLREMVISGLDTPAPAGLGVVVWMEGGLACWDVPPIRPWGHILGGAGAAAGMTWFLGATLSWWRAAVRGALARFKGIRRMPAPQVAGAQGKGGVAWKPALLGAACLVGLLSLVAGWTYEKLPDHLRRRRAIAALKDHHGYYSVSEAGPGKPTVYVGWNRRIPTADSGLIPLKELPEVQVLDLYGSPITDAGLENLKGLTNLERLNLWGTRVTDEGLVHLSGLTELQSLDLSKTRVTGTGLIHLKNLTKLEELGLRTDITDASLEPIKELPSLRRLDIGYTEITDSGLAHLKQLPNLRYVVLRGTQVTEEGMKDLQRALPELEIFP